MPRFATKTLLTPKGIDAIEPAPAGKRIDKYDSQVPGFGLRVTDKGSKTFFLLATLPGATVAQRLTLGRADVLGLAVAREKARAWLDAIIAGTNPVEAQVEAKAAKVAEVAEAKLLVVEVVIDQFIAAELGADDKLTNKQKDIARALRVGFAAPWKGKDIRLISNNDISEILLAKKVTHPAQAFAWSRYIRRFFTWALAVGKIDRDPAVVTARLIKAPEPRKHTLSNTELALLWQAATEMGYPHGPALKLIILTGCRRSEVVNARWSEFDLKAKVWTIPAERMQKNDQPHQIDLTSDMLAVLETLPRFNAGDCLFSVSNGVRPMQFKAEAKDEIDAALPAGVRHFTIHDLRRTMRTALDDLGVDDMVGEIMIAHKKKGLNAVYRQSDFRAKRRAGFEAWNAKVMQIVSEQAQPLAA